MSRAPFVLAKAASAFDRNAEIYDTTIGWRFVNPKMRDAYGDDTMPSTAENVADEFNISREDQDAFAQRSQERTGGRSGQRPARARDRPGRNPAAQGRRAGRRQRRTSAAHQPRRAGEAEADRPQGRHCDRGQCLGGQRRCRGADRRLRGSCEAQWSYAACTDSRRRGCRRSAADHGHRARASEREIAGAPRHLARRARRDRAQRGLRGAGAGRVCASSAFPTTRRR